MGLIYFLKRHRCYLEGSEFEVITDNQVLKYFFTKQTLSRREARWLEELSNFGIFPINLKAGKIHVVGDLLSRAPNALLPLNISNIEVCKIDTDFIVNNYNSDQYFGRVLEALKGIWPTDDRRKYALKKVIDYFKTKENPLYYENKLCLPRRSVSEVLQLAHDLKPSGHHGTAKTLARLDQYHWKNKSKDVKAYVSGCTVCQQMKDHSGKKLTDPQPL